VSRALGGENFSVAEAVGGWRGFTESVVPGAVFVVAYIGWGGFRIPVIASLAAVTVMVVARLIQRTPVTQALSGVLGVALGALWAWRSGDAGGYFVPGLWLNAGYLVALIASVLARWPAVGVVMGFVKGWGTRWRDHPGAMRAMSLATLIVAGLFAVRLAVQVPLYLADEVAILGTAKLAMGVPLFALTLWIVWLMVRLIELPAAPEDQPQKTE
jgi:hypothetical protein